MREKDQFSVLAGEFDVLQKRASGESEELSRTIAEGRVPAAELVHRIDVDIERMQSLYEQIWLAAAELLPQEPGEKVAVPELVERVGENRLRCLREAGEVLDAFVRVRSLVDEYQRAIAPVQKAAAELLEQVRAGEVERPESLPEQTAKERLFLDALRCEDPDSTDGIQLLTTVGEQFSAPAMLGLARGRYYLEGAAEKEPAAEQEPQPQAREQEKTVPVEAPVPAEPAEEPPKESAEPVQEEPAQEPEMPAPACADAEPQEAEEPVEEPAAEQEPRPQLLQALGRIRTQRPSESMLRKALRISPMGIFVLPVLTRLGVVTAAQAAQFTICAGRGDADQGYRNEVEWYLDTLADKGYLAAYPLDWRYEKKAYCLTKPMSALLGRRQTQKLDFWTMEFGNFSLEGGQSIEREQVSRILEENDLLLRYLDMVHRLFSLEVCGRVADSVERLGEGYAVDVPVGGEIAHCQIVSPALLSAGVHGAKLLVTDRAVLEGTEADLSDSTLFFLDELEQEIRQEREEQGEESPAETAEALQEPADAAGKDEPREEENPAEAAEPLQEEPVDAGEKPAEEGPADTQEQAVSPQEECGKAAESAEEPQEPAEDAGGLSAESAPEPADEREEQQVSQEAAESQEPAEPQESGTEEPQELPVSGEEDSDPRQRLQELLSRPQAISDEELRDLMIDVLEGRACVPMAEDSALVQALLLGRAADVEKELYPQSERLYQQLVLASHSHLETPDYTSERLEEFFPETGEHHEALLLGAWLFALLVPGRAYDYSLHYRSEQMLRDFGELFPTLGCVRPLAQRLTQLGELLPMGFTGAVLSLIGSANETEQFAAVAAHRARELFTLPTGRTMVKDLPKLYRQLYGPDTQIHRCLEIVAAGSTDQDDLRQIRDCLEHWYDGQDGDYHYDPKKMSDGIDEVWFRVNVQGSAFELKYAARDQVVRRLQVRLSLLSQWLQEAEIRARMPIDPDRASRLADEIVLLAEQARERLQESGEGAALAMALLLERLQTYLGHRSGEELREFSELLGTGVISLDEQGLPLLGVVPSGIRYYEPWRLVLRHLCTRPRTFAEAAEEICDVDSPLLDNLCQLRMIGVLTGKESEEQFSPSEELLQTAEQNAQVSTRAFLERMELAYTYGRIDEVERERLCAVVRQAGPQFSEIRDFGCWRQFLEALGHWAADMTLEHHAQISGMLEHCLEGHAQDESAPILQEARRLLDEEHNFAVAEEYINRFLHGERELSEGFFSALHEPDSFADFLSEKVFAPIWDLCNENRGRNFQIYGWDYVSGSLPADWTSRLIGDSRGLIGNWPVGKNGTSGQQVANLFRALGFEVTGAMPSGGRHSDNMECFQVHVRPTPRSEADYRHPIALFGTQMPPVLDVVILYGTITAQQLVDRVTSLGLGGMSIVLVNSAIDRLVRRQISEIFHTRTSGQNPFLLVDQVLAIYLAQHQVTERLPILLKCTLPYTAYQPFVRDGGSTADEMFCGRRTELSAILDMGGATIVYGGRQLGKTALLLRAQSLANRPEKKEYAFYCSLRTCPPDKSVPAFIADQLRRKTGLRVPDCDTMAELAGQIEGLFERGKVVQLLMLLDETDNYLASIAPAYAPLDALDNLHKTCSRFKFVLAGLHNVSRARRATEGNGVVGRFGQALCIRPLSPTDAMQLLMRPLQYLGFRVDDSVHLETILASTNYYPGILQFFGYKLVETLSEDYSRYYRALDGQPPFDLRDQQLGAIMNSGDINNSIRSKVQMTLELDPRYFSLARCIALLYYTHAPEQTWDGFSLTEIREMIDLEEIRCLEREENADLENLLHEMEDMGILSEPAEGRFGLRRSSFASIIGRDEEKIEEDIREQNRRDEAKA